MMAEAIRARDRLRQHRRHIEPVLFLAPTLVIYGLFAFYPVLYAFYLSLVRWNGLSPLKRFVGLSNYDTVLFQDPIFWVAVRNTVVWAALSLAVSTTLGLGLALLLNRPMPGRTLFRAVIYAPAILSTIVVSMVWDWMYNPFFGLVNSALQWLGLGGLARPWLGDEAVALFAVFVASVWQTGGVGMVLFLAGLQGLPAEIVEAAHIDGAGRMATFLHIVLPLLRSSFGVVIALTLVNSLKAFDLVYAMTYGGPANTSQLLATWAYFQAFINRDFGVGSAIAVILLVLTLAIVVPYMRWATREQ
jgi:raffinose/stachyose/melibiose transport system permease protein